MSTAQVKPVHLLVDLENVQPAPDQLRAYLTQGASAWIFHGANQKKLLPPLQALGNQVTPVPTAKPGKNSLDFHLIFYLGYLASRNNHCRFVVLSNDKGYDPAIAHARILGLEVIRTKELSANGGDRAATAAPSKNAASNGKAKPPKGAKAKKPATSAAAKPAPKSGSSASAKSMSPLEKVMVYLRNHPKLRPTTAKRLERHIPSIVGGKVSAEAGPQLVAELQRRGHIRINGDVVEYTLSKKK
jgi:hypothetical protein